ncbi:Beta,beta-carotene 15,15'-dioxygenase [Paraphaeosphaeria sporulosa]
MPCNAISLVVALTAVGPVFAFHNFNPDFLPKHSELDVSPLYNGLPPEGIDQLALGFYATQEITDPIELEVEGDIPPWVSGSLYRGAQATWDVGNFTSEHWFDGFSRQHRFEIKNGKVTYRSRNGSDEVQDFVRETGLYPGGSFGNDPCKAIFGAFEVTFRDKGGNKGDSDKNSVAIAHIKNFPGLARNSTNFGPMVNLVITTDGGNALQQIDPVTLEPIELFIYDGPNFLNPGSTFTSAHPGIGPNHEVYNYILDFQADPPIYQVFAIEADGRGRVLANITDAPPAYIHSVSSTENYVIQIIWQSDLGPPPEEGAPLLDFIQPWDPERRTLFYVIDKKNGGIVAEYTAPAFFAFHEVNSFEDGEDIVIDLTVFPDNSWLENARLVHLRKVGPNNPNIDIDLAARFRRFRLGNFRDAREGDDLEAKIELEIPYDIGNIELPRINDNYHHKPYRYAYGVHTVKRGFFVDSIVKIDIETQTTTLWVPETNHLPSEPIFVPRPGCDDEDDGVLLSVAMNSATSRSNLVVIDAKSMKELGRAKMPIAMGYGFHGLWGA